MRKVAEEEQSGLELFPNTVALVSKNDRLVDYQREKKSNANGSPGKINQRVCKGKTPVLVGVSLCRKAVRLPGKISRPAVLELLKTRDGNIDNQRENDRVESKRKNALGQSEATHAA